MVTLYFAAELNNSDFIINDITKAGCLIWILFLFL
jgi:hypothetical protein